MHTPAAAVLSSNLVLWFSEAGPPDHAQCPALVKMRPGVRLQCFQSILWGRFRLPQQSRRRVRPTGRQRRSQEKLRRRPRRRRHRRRRGSGAARPKTRCRPGQVGHSPCATRDYFFGVELDILGSVRSHLRPRHQLQPTRWTERQKRLRRRRRRRKRSGAARSRTRSFPVL